MICYLIYPFYITLLINSGKIRSCANDSIFENDNYYVYLKHYLRLIYSVCCYLEYFIYFLCLLRSLGLG